MLRSLMCNGAAQYISVSTGSLGWLCRCGNHGYGGLVAYLKYYLLAQSGYSHTVFPFG